MGGLFTAEMIGEGLTILAKGTAIASAGPYVVGGVAAILIVDHFTVITVGDLPRSHEVDIDNLPEGWTRDDNNGRIHVRDGNGKMRVRIDPPDSGSPYKHRHNYDELENPLDKNGEIVDRKSPDAHIPVE